MKILSNKKHSELLEKIKDLESKINALSGINNNLSKKSNEYDSILKSKENFIEHLNGQNEFLKKIIIDSKTNFSIKRLVVGQKASGKTTFVKSLLPKIKNYFIVDVNKEYDLVPKANKMNINFESKNWYSNLLTKIEQNKDRIIIIDCVDFIRYKEFLDYIFNLHNGFNFIIVAESLKPFTESHISQFDYVYNFGCEDKIYSLLNNSKIMNAKKQEVEKKEILSKNDTDLIKKGMKYFCLTVLGLAVLSKL